MSFIVFLLISLAVKSALVMCWTRVVGPRREMARSASRPTSSRRPKLVWASFSSAWSLLTSEVVKLGLQAWLAMTWTVQLPFCSKEQTPFSWEHAAKPQWLHDSIESSCPSSFM